MNREEQLAKAYLESLQAGEVVFEPLGKTKIPDFSLANQIGVEVRRLNENYFGESQTEGLEQVDRPIWKALNETLASFEGKKSPRSYWVMIEFERPLDLKGKQLRSAIKHALAGFLASTPEDSTSSIPVDVCNGLQLLLYPSALTSGNPFRVAGSSDMDSGGMVVQLYIQNIKHCITDKSQKTLPVQSQYDGWWLLLVDYLRHGLLDNEMAEVEQAVTNLGAFARVILLDHNGQAPLFDISAVA